MFVTTHIPSVSVLVRLRTKKCATLIVTHAMRARQHQSLEQRIRTSVKKANNCLMCNQSHTQHTKEEAQLTPLKRCSFSSAALAYSTNNSVCETITTQFTATYIWQCFRLQNTYLLQVEHHHQYHLMAAVNYHSAECHLTMKEPLRIKLLPSLIRHKILYS